MQIWVDADACPKPIKEILFRAAIRTQITTTFVANQALQTPSSVFIKKIQVMSGFDVTDNYILSNLSPGDLVITGDIPLADAVITKSGIALNPRGELYTKDNIKYRLLMRNINDNLRASGGIAGGGFNTLGKKELVEFSNNLDRILSKNITRKK